MSDLNKTLCFVGAAVALVLIAWAVSPSKVVPDAFDDQGEAFFPDFTDPNEATTLEVVSFNEASGSPNVFKVTFDGSEWTIPSHHDYPADAKDQLAKTAAGVIGIKKDDFRTSNVSDHEACGVIDPMDEAAVGLSGRGTRIKVSNASDQVLADFIIGGAVKGRPGYRFVRVPGQGRVFASKVDLNLSVKFKDWIDTDLLAITGQDIDRIQINDYSVNERTRRVEQRDKIDLYKSSDDAWRLRGSGAKNLDTAKVKSLVLALGEVSIVGVRQKPSGLSAGLTKSTNLELNNEALSSLMQKGFYVSQDGNLVSNEGEIDVHTKNGIRYTLRFGELLVGSGMTITAGITDDNNGGSDTEARYLFVTAEFDDSYFKLPPKPASRDFVGKPDSLLTDADRENKRKAEAYDEVQAKIAAGQAQAGQLRERFAPWYYLIDAASFDQVKLTRSELTSAS